MSSAVRRIPYGADVAVRKRQDLERAQKEQAASRGLAASQIGSGGLLKVDGSLQVTGSITVPGTLSSAGAVSAGTTVTAGTDVTAAGNLNGVNSNLSGYLFTPAGYAFDITYTRRGAWLGNDGRLGWASSSITAKELLDSIPEPDAATVLEIASHHYQRKAELAKRDDPSSEGYVGPDYHVAVEWGAIAEELHGLGLWQVVIYEWDVEYLLEDVLDVDGHPILNDDGLHLKQRVGQPIRLDTEPRPIGVHYELLGLLAIIAARFNRSQHLELVARVEALEKVQGL